MNKKRLFIIVLILALSIKTVRIQALPQQNATIQNANDPALYVRLFNATYGDFDSDGKEDDIECYLEITLNDDFVRTNLIVDIHLTLPDGYCYSYSILISMTYDTITLNIKFMNHAYLSGYYTIKAEINLFTHGYYYEDCEIVFDPPSEEVPDDDPFITFSAV